MGFMRDSSRDGKDRHYMWATAGQGLQVGKFPACSGNGGSSVQSESKRTRCAMGELSRKIS